MLRLLLSCKATISSCEHNEMKRIMRYWERISSCAHIGMMRTMANMAQLMTLQVFLDE